MVEKHFADRLFDRYIHDVIIGSIGVDQNVCRTKDYLLKDVETLGSCVGVVHWLVRLPKTASLAQVGEDSNGRDSNDELVITQKSNTKFLIN